MSKERKIRRSLEKGRTSYTSIAVGFVLSVYETYNQEIGMARRRVLTRPTMFGTLDVLMPGLEVSVNE